MKYYNAKYLLFILPVLIMFGGFVVRFKIDNINPAVSENLTYIKYKNNIVNVEIANDFNELRQGLSNREDLAPDSGMLFIFPQRQVRLFWMKNMLFPIDIVWLDGNKIVKIDRNLPPEGTRPKNSYSSLWPVNFVLELSAGDANKLGLKVGAKVEYYLK